MPFLKFYSAIALLAVSVNLYADDILDSPAAPAQSAECPVMQEEKSLDTEYGSAGFIKNLAESADSIRMIAARLLESALSAENAPSADCVSSCPDQEIAEVIYRVAPVAFLADDQQNEICLTLEEQTSVEPMRFEARSFDSVPKLNDWIMAFSQGRGVDGKLLYERCSSNCSPRYTFHIAEQPTGYEVTAEVLCGIARDKANDQYLISTALRRSCATN